MINRQQQKLSILILLIVISAFSVTLIKDLHRSAFIKHDQLQAEHHKLQTEWGKLQLEYSAFVMNKNIESLAHQQIGMEYPKDIIAVEIK